MMSMKQTWLPARLPVRHRSRIIASEKAPLPAPMMLILGAILFLYFIQHIALA